MAENNIFLYGFDKNLNRNVEVPLSPLVYDFLQGETQKQTIKFSGDSDTSSGWSINDSGVANFEETNTKRIYLTTGFPSLDGFDSSATVKTLDWPGVTLSTLAASDVAYIKSGTGFVKNPLLDFKLDPVIEVNMIPVSTSNSSYELLWSTELGGTESTTEFGITLIGGVFTAKLLLNAVNFSQSFGFTIIDDTLVHNFKAAVKNNEKKVYYYINDKLVKIISYTFIPLVDKGGLHLVMAQESGGTANFIIQSVVLSYLKK